MGLSAVAGVNASSHREAPLISQDPVADNTDVYAFISPDDADTVTLIANWIPAEDPAAGPNYYHFGEDVLYSIHIDNNGDAIEDITYEWRFRDEIVNPNTFLYATGEITSLDDENYNYRQRYDLFEVRGGQRRLILGNAIMPPDNVGISTPNYDQLAGQAVYDIEGDGKTFAGQRDDAFFADIGSIFDLGQLRPFLPNYQPAERDAQEPVDFFAGYNVHTTSIQVPISALTQGDEPVIGVWSTASRPKVRVFNQNNGAAPVNRGRFVQISRLGNPLVNEVVIPLGVKDTFNALPPRGDAAALSQPQDERGVTIPVVQDPELARLITQLYDIETPEPPRNDLVSIFLTGIEGVNQPQNVQPAEMLRLNTDSDPEDVAWPNGRKLEDDVIDIALRAVAGGTPFNPEFNDPDRNDNGEKEEDEDQPNNDLADGVNNNDLPFLGQFPYQATPFQGYGENNDLRGRTTNGDSTVTEPGVRE